MLGEDWMLNMKKNPVANSIKGYVKEIFFLQFLHLPNKKNQTNNRDIIKSSYLISTIKTFTFAS